MGAEKGKTGATVLRWALLGGGLLAGSWVLPSAAWASGAHGDPVASLALSLAVILMAAKLGGELAVRAGQAAVVGELLAGVLLGNLPLLGFHGFVPVSTDATVDLLARLGALLLLFEVGVESTVGQMFSVGLPAVRIAVLGVAVPFALGWGVAAVLLPQAPVPAQVFMGLVLTATSVGITARVLKDLGRGSTDEARIILGAAIFDDVLALFLMAVAAGMIAAADVGGAVPYGTMGLTLTKALVFLAGGIAVGYFVTPRLFHSAIGMRSRGVLLTLGLGMCFLGAWAADMVGLAPIVGAFAAGLVLEDLHSRPYVERGEPDLVARLEPLTSFLAPVFFVLMGMRTDLRVFADLGSIGLAAAFTVAAVVGKLACALGAPRKNVNRLAVAIGMVPRGEVSLIFANIGAALTLGGQPIVPPAVFSAFIVMAIVTTLLAPPALAWSLQRGR